MLTPCAASLQRPAKDLFLSEVIVPHLCHQEFNYRLEKEGRKTSLQRL
jgi:hypothetical protein